MPQEPVPECSEAIEIPQLKLAQEAMRSNIGARHDDAGKDFRRARYSQSGCCQDCQLNSQSLEHPVRD